MGKRLGFVGIVTLIALYLSAPTIIYFSIPKADRGDATKVADAIPDWLPESYLVKLGLDLQGGVQLVLGVNTEGAIENKLSRIGTEASRWASDQGMAVKTAYVVKGEGVLRIELDPATTEESFREKFALEYVGLEVRQVKDQTIDYGFSSDEMTRIRQSALDQAVRVVRNRVDKWGVAEPLISRRADGSILVQLPGFSDPDKAKELLGRTAQLQFKMVDEAFAGFDSLPVKLPDGVSTEALGQQISYVSENKEQLIELLKPFVPQDRELLFEEEEIAGGRKIRYRSYVLFAATELGGEDILDSSVRSDTRSLESGPVVHMQFTGQGGKRFSDLTGANVGNRLAIVLDQVVVSAPNIQTRIDGGAGTITLGQGDYNTKFEEASQLSLILKSGALPATIEVLEERQVGATLGPELAQQGVYAILVGLLLVLVFLVAYYRRPGAVACIALTLNGLYMLAMMAAFGFALSLPGIAGFILTLGMAVDANVLINERIRQELREGKNARKAVGLGFDKVFWTIVDANITTLIAAVVLLETSSSGPIRGFAVTLIIGLSVSIFTALYCTKIFFDVALRNMSSDSEIRKWCGGESALKSKVFNFDFMGLKNITAIFGLVSILAVVGVISTRGLNWAVDFAGGTEVEVAFAKDVDPSVVRGIVEKAGVADATLQALEGGSQKYLIRFDKDDSAGDAKLHSAKVTDLLRSELKDSSPDILRVDFVGPQVGKELRVQGALSLLWAVLGIFIYIGLRFDMRFGPGAVAKMIQDVFMVLGFYAFFWRSFDLTAVAALLTVIGYSVNDVIVIYDRIRENLLMFPKRALRDNINTSLNETLGRSINTSLSTIISLIGVLIFGTAQIWNFAAAMVIGVCAATFSSTFLASSMVLWFEDWKKFQASKAKKSRA
jgi:protein-export membrane protein SecD/preprotein translocase SecF subunit